MSHPLDQPVAGEAEPAEPGRPARTDGLLADIRWVLGSYLVLGVVGGLLWWLLVDPALFTKTSGGLVMGEDELARRFAADGWYSVIGGVLGLVSGAVLTWWRSRDPLRTAVLVLVGSGLAAAVMAGLGVLLGPPDPASAAAGAAVGARLPTRLDVTGTVCYLVWPIGALVGALFVLFSPPPQPRA